MNKKIKMVSLNTNRLLLRLWKEQDLSPFAKMNANPQVMEFFPKIMTYEESIAAFCQIIAHFTKYGWGLWAVELKTEKKFIGFIGLSHVVFQAHFTPAVEIGWRLQPKYWGKGYATEGAFQALQFGFNTLGLKEIVSFTSNQNIRSQKIMEKIGMSRNSKDDFHHPKLPSNHWLKKHVLYRKQKS